MFNKDEMNCYHIIKVMVSIGPGPKSTHSIMLTVTGWIPFLVSVKVIHS